MYCVMFSAAIRLRYKEPNVHRPYRVPGGNVGMWIVSGVGLITLAACFFIAFIPPPGLSMMSPAAYICMLLGIAVAIGAIPIVVFRLRRPAWQQTLEVQAGSHPPPPLPPPPPASSAATPSND
jgi:amino acid transporter